VARIKCIMMQRDETQLLEPWLRYHGHLFGYQNLVVLDHGSRDPEVVALLHRYAAAGVAVERLAGTPEEYLRKGEYTARAIRRLDETEAYDFALPMDCDEFLTLFDHDTLSSCRAAIHAAFDALVGERRALRVEMAFANAVGDPGWFSTGVIGKGFLPANSVSEIDHGCHQPRSRLAEGVRETAFCYWHFHNKPFPVLLDHARRKLEKRVDHRDPEALRRYSGDGEHLVPYFFMTPAQYAAMSDDLVRLFAPHFVRVAASLGIDEKLFGQPVPHGPQTLEVRPPGGPRLPFQAEAYLRAHEDVRAAGVNPLYHYLRYGWREGRSLR
jgi:hypothetical protein